VFIYEISKESKQEIIDENDFIDLDKQENKTEETGEISKEELIIEEEYIPTTTSTCNELNGKICNEDETCDGEIEYAREAPCCLGTCIKKLISSTGKIIGWVIILVIIGFLFWFFKFKYRGSKKEINLLQIGRSKKIKTKIDKKSAISKLDEFKKKFSN
jgi:hypothetical protein